MKETSSQRERKKERERQISKEKGESFKTKGTKMIKKDEDWKLPT